MDHRIVEVLQDGKMRPTFFRDLKEGDRFKIYDEPGVPAHDQDVLYTALSDPYPNEEGVYTIKVEW